jgi:hypothetical protein
MDIIKVKRYLTIISLTVGIVTGLATLIGIGFSAYERYCSDAALVFEMKKFIRGKHILYLGNVKNDAKVHAQELTFKAEFRNGLVKDINVYPSADIIKDEDIRYGNPEYYADFFLKRLSRNSSCNIDVTVKAKSEVYEDIHMSWKNKGEISITPSQADSNAMRQFTSTLRFHEITDPSYDARKRRFISNTKGINK